MNPGPEADRVLLAHMRDCLDRILEYTNAERSRYDASRLVQDAVIRNLQRPWPSRASVCRARSRAPNRRSHGGNSPDFAT